MDVDISDILAEISRPPQPTSSTTDPSPLLLPSSYSSPSYTYDSQTAYTDHILLTRHWTTERSTPTLQPYPTILITRTMDRVRAQINRIEDLTSGNYPGSGSSMGGQHQDTQNLNLILSILQTDLSRTQFLMRSYLRQRLSKITKHATYYAKHHLNSSTETDQKSTLLSESEREYLTAHTTLLSNLYSSSFLLSLPQNLRRLDDSTGGSARMDEGPDVASGVVVRCLAGEGWSNEAEVAEGDADGEGEGDEGRATVRYSLERGGVVVGRWRDLKSGVETGALEVL